MGGEYSWRYPHCVDWNLAGIVPGGRAKPLPLSMGGIFGVARKSSGGTSSAWGCSAYRHGGSLLMPALDLAVMDLIIGNSQPERALLSSKLPSQTTSAIG